jgi:hypothetical protein
VIANARLRKAMRAIARKKGDFTLFAIVRRSDAFGCWDLVVSAPWLGEGTLKATRELVRLLSDSIGKSSLPKFARVVTLKADHPMVKFMLDNFAVDDGERRMPRTDVFGPHIEEGIVIRAKRPVITRRTARRVA